MQNFTQAGTPVETEVIVLPIDLPPASKMEHQQSAAPRYMSVMEFATRLDKGIPVADLTTFRRTRIASYEDLPDYLNFLRSLGSVVVREGRFVRA